MTIIIIASMTEKRSLLFFAFVDVEFTLIPPYCSVAVIVVQYPLAV